MHELETVTSLIWTTLGSIGGAVKVTVQLLGMEQLPNRVSVFWLFAANMFVSAFAGFMGAVLIEQFTPNDDYHVIAAGIAGYMGVTALDYMTEWFKTKVKIS